MGGPGSRRKARPYTNLKEIDRYATFLQNSAIEKCTTKCYQTGARDYISFCNNHNLSLQPTPLTLSRYITYTSHSIASALKYLTGAQHYLKDIYPKFNNNRNHPLQVVLSTIRGAKKVRADPVKRKLPLRLSHLSSFVSHSTVTQKYDNLLFATIMSCAFYGCHRMGELVIKSDKSLFDSRKIIKRSSLVFDNTHAQYRLPYHKADAFIVVLTLFFPSSTILRILFTFYDATLPCMMHVMDPVFPSFCVKTGPCLIGLGSITNFSNFFPMIMGAILLAQEVPLSLPRWAFLPPSFKPLAGGHLQHGRFTFATIQLFVLNINSLPSVYTSDKINPAPRFHLFYLPHPPHTTFFIF